MEKLLLVVFGPLAIAAALYVAVMGLRQLFVRWRARLTPEQLEAKRKVYRNRLLNPQAEAVERELGKALPARLLRLYADRDLIQSGGFEIEKSKDNARGPEQWPLYCFEPLDTEALNDLPYEDELGAGFCFATTGGRSWYWMAASDTRAEDGPVIFLDYDGGKRHGEQVAETLAAFLAWPRVAMK